MPDSALTELTDASMPQTRAGEIARGTLRLLAGHGYFGVTEMTLANNRRADIAAVGPAGEIAMVEIKSSVADFRADSKWPDYMPFCDRFYFAVMADFPQDLLPEAAGLIVADAFGGAVIREAIPDKLAGARRKAVILRFARLAAGRLQAGQDAGWTAAQVSHT
ncbi:MmcB family DNA repair protein [Hyphomonas sp.]|uniref:MmcB family DNA repair protein n=1 Tax=Hyphomonas sp. TaxID=87 RepID=UPI0035681D49